jgi:hypothetical protein
VTRVERRLDPFVVGLARADLWAAALAGFLVRGGLVLFLVPIVVIPSPLDVANLLGPAVTSAALGGPNPDLVRLVAFGSAATAVVVVVAFLLGAAMDVAVTRITAAGVDDRAASGLDREAARSTLARALAVRLAALVPLAIVVAVGVPSVVDATYHELIDPTDLLTPIVIRVLRDVPGVVVALLVAWLLGEAIGGLGVRLVVLRGAGVARSLAGAIALVLRRPVSALAALVVGTVLLVALVGPALAASGLVWRFVAYSLASPGGALPALVGVLALSALWLGGLVLAGFGAAVRALLWTGVATER